MRQTPHRTDRKLPYEKPILRVVSIAEGLQTLGIGCKLQTSGPTRGTSNPCSIPMTSCNRVGS